MSAAVEWPGGPPEHSSLGGSGAHRWMTCAGSVGLSEGVEDPDSDYSTEGTAAHKLAAECLGINAEAWWYVGGHVEDGGHGDLCLNPDDEAVPQDAVPVSKDMADAVQVYLSQVRHRYPGVALTPEHKFYAPTIHRWFYGMIDLPVPEVPGEPRVLDLWDYKHGAGIVVEVPMNPQIMYYGCGYLEVEDAWDRYDWVRLRVAQPRGWHGDGPIREWTVSVDDLMRWLEEDLLPAMELAESSTDTKSGEHCRFCPARLNYCPQLLTDADEIERYLEMIKERELTSFSNEDLGRFMDLSEVMKIAVKAARDTGFRRAEKGATIPGWKLARARANRSWRDEVEPAAKKMFGEDAMTKPELKSPAKLEELPGGSDFTAEWAFKPDRGLQLVKAGDPRAESGPKQKTMFKPQGKAAGGRKKK